MVDVKQKMSKLKKILKAKKGQLSVGNIIGILIAIVVFSLTLPMMSNFINDAQATAGATTDTILAAIIPLMAVGLIWMVFTYSRPTYQQPR